MQNVHIKKSHLVRDTVWNFNMLLASSLIRFMNLVEILPPLLAVCDTIDHFHLKLIRTFKILVNNSRITIQN